MFLRFAKFLMIALAFASCDEIAPTVTGSMGNTGPGPDLTNQQRQVLIEEFTGVRCVNCPAGSAAIEDLIAIHGPQLVAVSIHAGEFAPPYSDSQYDFRTPEGDQLLSYLGEPFGYPTAVVNRKLFDGEFDLQLGQSQWAGYIQQELQEPPKVKLKIEPSYNAQTEKLDALITILVVEDVVEPDVRLSIMITESGVQDMQLTPSGKQADYTHKHILRTMMTNYDGAVISDELTAGKQITKSFSMDWNPDWDVNNCDILAFVSLGGTAKDVLQAHHVHIIE
ncbi:MAG: hypothetical protein D6816_01945 [Bacteroidetes bacterium]|nr:MAG: hypothetical protein D6816_01945 [Bacteroidota bacterium]